MSRTSAFLLAIALLLPGPVAAQQKPRPRPAPAPAAPKFFSNPLSPDEMKGKQAVLDTDLGEIVLDLLPEAAPTHVGHFIVRAREGAYDGTTFHRAVRLGLIQGGDPLSKDPAQKARYGQGGFNELKFEPNAEMHTRGAVSAVHTTSGKDTAGNQFFICVSDQPTLNGEFTVFARVAEGAVVAQKISQAEATDNVINDRIVIRKVTIRDKPAPVPEPFSTETVEQLSKQRAVIETAMGTITLEFFPDKAPDHVRNFLRLAASGVYDGTAFHRVVQGFVIQGGFMPTRKADLSEKQESYIRNLRPEFSSTLHEAGIVSMARGEELASASTSFFIMLAATPALDGKYSVFGRVVDGMDVVRKIEAVPVNGEEPVTRVEVKTIRVVPAR